LRIAIAIRDTAVSPLIIKSNPAVAAIELLPASIAGLTVPMDIVGVLPP